MNGKKWVRPLHRWTSIAFTVTVVACFAFLGQAESLPWLFYLPLPPLAVLLFSGLYLFSLPYLGKRRARAS
ncbi:hypothetical protein [Saccharothrix syringae]|uniref:Uncharacterized protein n=1 Tax=Saccharothrix syringae TaxID=103733 RepID=A0A5Q0H7X1_SACSY|nr:hypothetical protein [Saccharothrix syringae]QFZ22289.1 hypothetical protein EKG83_37055 [Saccharothrix syringae]